MTTQITWHDVNFEYPKAQYETDEYWDGSIAVLATVCHQSMVKIFYAYSNGTCVNPDGKDLEPWQVPFYEERDRVPMWSFIGVTPNGDEDFKEDDKIVAWAYMPTYKETAEIANKLGYHIPINS